MGDWEPVAERLRQVKAARRRFMQLWRVERAFVDPLLDRLAEDMAQPVSIDTQNVPKHVANCERRSFSDDES